MLGQIAQAQVSDHPADAFGQALQFFLAVKPILARWIIPHPGVDHDHKGLNLKCQHCGYWMERFRYQIETAESQKELW